MKSGLKEKSMELNDFQLRNIRLLIKMFENGALDDEAAEILRESELDYFSISDKISKLENKINIDENTSLLKYNKNYLTLIMKTASRIHFNPASKFYNISFIRFNIDDFSLFNERYGHEAGDKAINEIAGIIKESSRPTDYIIRSGGEEFDSLLPATGLNGAIVYTEKIIDKIRKTSILHNGLNIPITLSAGISHIEYELEGKKLINEQETEICYGKLQNEASQALYEAKFLGKDRLGIYDAKKSAEYVNIRKTYIKK